MNKKKFTYKKSGVNIRAADNFVNFISTVSSKKKGKKKFSNIGGFGSISDIPNHIKQPKIVACTDGVGTKIEIANTLNKFDTIGIDLVAMSVNDLIVQGAKPLLFLDYISINKIVLTKLKSIIKGIVKGCKQSMCELVGGETAEMPGTYEKGKFDIAGFAVGIVGKDKILSKNKIKNNDLILAIPSSGLHSNGYSLVKYRFIFSYLLGLIIKQKPTPQLNVLSISLSDIPFLFSHLKIFKVLTLLRLISATKLFGITLLMLSAKPPPVIFAHPLIKFLLINFSISFT